MIKVQPQMTVEAANAEAQDQAMIKKQRQMYQAQMMQRIGELTKDLDAFYTIFIK